MDITQNIYKRIEELPFDPEDPLKLLEDVFGTTSEKKWMRLGFNQAFNSVFISVKRYLDIQSPLSAKRETVDFFEKILCKYLAILNEIIPRLPNSFEQVLSERIDFRKKSSRSEYRFVIVDHLIDLLLKSECLISLFDIPQYLKIDRLSIEIPVLKGLYYTSEKTIQDNWVAIRQLLIHLETTAHYCKVSGQSMFTRVLYVLTKTRSADLCKDLLTNNNTLVFLRFLFTKSDNTKCPVMKHLKAWYDKNNMEEYIESNYELKLFHEVCQIWETDIQSAITMFRDLLNKSNCECQIASSGILKPLESMLTDLSNKENDSFNIQTFLTIFLRFKTDHLQYSWDGKDFKRLFELVVLIVSHLSKKCLAINYDGMLIEDINYTKEILMEDLLRALRILQVLTILNESWGHWFDVVDAPKIIDKWTYEKITSSHKIFDSLLDNEKLHPHYDNNQFQEMASACTSAFSFSSRYVLCGITRELHNCDTQQVFEISKNDVLSNMIQIFDSNDDSVLLKCHFKFKGKFKKQSRFKQSGKVYNLLSEELRKHFLNIRQGRELNTLYLKPLENTKMYFMVGKLLAKMFIDKERLDIPLNLNFFRSLCDSRYSYLRKSYFDVLEIFPSTRQLIKELIEIKRIKQIIQSEPTYSDSQKNDLIKNLTFENGKRLDDLSLYFTIPGTDIELRPGGSDIMLTPFNVEEYLDLLSNIIHEPFEQCNAIRDGFEQMLPGCLNLFSSRELKRSIINARFTIEDLESGCKFNREAYSLKYKPIQYLFEIVTSLSRYHQQRFLALVTGRYTLPLDGLNGLDPPLTIIVLTNPFLGETPLAIPENHQFLLPQDFKKKHILILLKMLYEIDGVIPSNRGKRIFIGLNLGH